jgi:2-polyprenyl-3-methyl-5-hydroxy-6-metoxy-1,4-benzoquinol methylase
MQFVPKRGKNALEIGCSPAVILNRLLDRNFTVWGIEPSERYIPFLREQAPEAHIVQGYFPEVTSRCEEGVFSCIISLDVAEHIDDFQGFFNEIHRLLTPDGTAIIMSPIILNRDGLIKKSDFIASEHAWIWTERFLEEYLKEFFKEVSFHRWINGHEIILLKK